MGLMSDLNLVVMRAAYPVVLFCYNRPDHLKQTLAALVQNEGSDETLVYVFSDGPKTAADVAKVIAVREMLAQVVGFREFNIVEQPTNKGLANSVIEGVRQRASTTCACMY